MLEQAVTSNLAPITAKLCKMIRMLASDCDGDVIAAARAIKRTLRSEGLDIHELAKGIEEPNGGTLTEAEMRKLYDAGYDAGLRAAEEKHHGAADFANVDGTPSWHEIALWCQQRNERLREKEREFVSDMASRAVWRDPTEKQGKWLKSIFYRLGGKRP
jgi:hypothetical protein